MNENDPEYHHFWHHEHWNKPMGDGELRTVDIKSQNVTPTIHKYKAYDWLDGIRERELPPCLIPWPLVSVDA